MGNKSGSPMSFWICWSILLLVGIFPLCFGGSAVFVAFAQVKSNNLMTFGLVLVLIAMIAAYVLYVYIIGKFLFKYHTLAEEYRESEKLFLRDMARSMFGSQGNTPSPESNTAAQHVAQFKRLMEYHNSIKDKVSISMEQSEELMKRILKEIDDITNHKL